MTGSSLTTAFAAAVQERSGRGGFNGGAGRVPRGHAGA
jgi:hypothetical protein